MPHGIMVKLLGLEEFSGIEQIIPHIIEDTPYFTGLFNEFDSGLSETVLSYMVEDKPVKEMWLYKYLDNHPNIVQRLFTKYHDFCDSAKEPENFDSMERLLKKRIPISFVNGEYDFLLYTLAIQKEGKTLAEKILSAYETNPSDVFEEESINNLKKGFSHLIDVQKKSSESFTHIDFPYDKKKSKFFYNMGVQIAAYIFNYVLKNKEKNMPLP